MSGDVITLDGLQTGKLTGGGDCGRIVPVHSSVLGQTVRMCEQDAKRLAGIGEISNNKGGRPRGATVANGARKPRVSKCKKTKIVETKTGRLVCKCADRGNGQILAGDICGLPTTEGK